jgi:hypothetical protein
MRTDIFVTVLAIVAFSAAPWWCFQHGPAWRLHTVAR